MKRLLCSFLATAMLVMLVPSAFAAEEGADATTDVLTYDFTSYGINGTSTSVGSATAKYEVTSLYTQPWEFVNMSPNGNNNTCYSDRMRYNWYGTETYQAPALGDAVIVLKVRIPAGSYSAMFGIYGSKSTINANLYLVPASETSIGERLGNDYGWAETLKMIPEEYFMGIVNGYASSAGVKNVKIKGLNVAADSEYYLIVVSNGVDSSYVQTSSGGKYYYEMGICSLTLDKSDVTAVSAFAPVEAMNIGDEVSATAEIARGENTYPADGNVVWTSENAYAAVDAATGKITGASEGIAKIKATCGGIESTVSVAIINPDKEEYVYNVGGAPLIDVTLENSKVPDNYLKAMSFYSVDPSLSAP